MEDKVRVTPVGAMDDETFMKHLELRHSNDLRMRFTPEPDRNERRLHASPEWRTFHTTMHRQDSSRYNHVHND